MKKQTYRFRIAQSIPARDIEETLMLSLMAVESLYGHTRVRMDSRFKLNKKRRICVIDADTRIGADLAKIFTGYATREFGDKAVEIACKPLHTCGGQGRRRPAAAGAAA